MIPHPTYIQKEKTKASPLSSDPEPLVPTSMTFDGPVQTLDQLRLALIQKMGPEKGQQMYDKFIQSILISSFGTIHKEMDRAQKASRKMRSIYKD